MTKEQKKQADEITRRVYLVEQNLAKISDMTKKSRILTIRNNLENWVEVSDRVMNIIFTIVDADYKDELAKLEAEFEAL